MCTYNSFDYLLSTLLLSPTFYVFDVMIYIFLYCVSINKLLLLHLF